MVRKETLSNINNEIKYQRSMVMGQLELTGFKDGYSWQNKPVVDDLTFFPLYPPFRYCPRCTEMRKQPV